jgi:hypothetical protein
MGMAMLLVAVAAALLAASPARRCDGEIEVITSQVAEDDSFWDVTRSLDRARGRRFRRQSTERFQAPVGSQVTGESFRSCQARSITSTE